MAAGVVSLYAVYGQLRSGNPAYHSPAAVGAIGSMVAMTAPLAWRRRFPISVATTVVAAFLVARIVVHLPVANVTQLAGWMALYSVAVHGQRRFRTPVLAVCFAAILAEIGRELFFVSSGGGPVLGQAFTFFYNAVVLALPWLLGAAIRSLRQREGSWRSRPTSCGASRRSTPAWRSGLAKRQRAWNGPA